MSFRDPLGALAVGPQTSLAAFTLFNAMFHLDGAPAARATAFGVLLIISTIATLAYRHRLRCNRTTRERALEQRTQDLQRQVLDIRRNVTQLGHVVDSRLAVEAWQQAFHRVELRNGRRPPIQVVRHEET